MRSDRTKGEKPKPLAAAQADNDLILHVFPGLNQKSARALAAPTGWLDSDHSSTCAEVGVFVASAAHRAELKLKHRRLD